MPKVGTLGHDMMFRSTTIQVCIHQFCISPKASAKFIFLSASTNSAFPPKILAEFMFRFTTAFL